MSTAEHLLYEFPCNEKIRTYLRLEALFQRFDWFCEYISGITLSGGDPLYSGNLNDVFHLVSTIRNLFPTKTIWLYTGFTWEQIMNLTNSDDILRKEIVSQCDVVVDGEYIDELRDITLKWRGSSNQRVIDVKKSIEKGEVILWSD